MKKLVTFAALLLIFAFNSINAQTEISPEKMKAIKELNQLVTQENKADDFAKAMSAQFSVLNEELIKISLAERKEIVPAEKVVLEKKLVEASQKYQKQFVDKLIEKVDYNKMIEEISITVYAKYYSLEEINDLIAFYKTPTGQKTLKVMQPMMLESMRLTQERLTPKIMAVMDELKGEQQKLIAQIIDELSPRKKN
ncbi:MAG: DUF2059 domain-containing protein [Pyrinomonadaceae bacterium]|nr:DUF2059 domain-containing protein [Pyrinomonadaceae bacterium]